MGRPPDMYTAEELVQILKDRQSGQTLQQFAAEIGLSFQMVSQVLNQTRSVGNEKVLDYLAPKGKKFVHQDVWYLVDSK